MDEKEEGVNLIVRKLGFYPVVDLTKLQLVLARLVDGHGNHGHVAVWRFRQRLLWYRDKL